MTIKHTAGGTRYEQHGTPYGPGTRESQRMIEMASPITADPMSIATAMLAQLEPQDTIVRTQVTWVRWDAKAMRNRTSHPYVWIWTDSDGTERTFDTKADAIAAREALTA